MFFVKNGDKALWRLGFLVNKMQKVFVNDFVKHLVFVKI